jgi:ceramide glucosyltransferase
VILTKDSNISFSRDTMRVMLRSLTPGVGLVCAVPVAVRAETLAGAIEAVLINRDARLLLTASALGKGFGVGKVMLFRRGDLERAGGLAAMAYTIAEDSALCKGFAAIGLATVFAEKTDDQEIGARSLADVYARQARWAVIRRAEEPLTFVFEPIACPVPAALAAALAAPLLGIGALTAFGTTLLFWYLIEVGVTAAKRWEVGPWTPLAFLGRDGVLLAAWARAWTTREVTWAGGRRDVRDIVRRRG